METKFTVPEISCGHCKETIESTINSLENVEAVNVDIDQKSVEVNSSTDLDLSLVSNCLLYTSPSPRDRSLSRMPSSA